MNQMRSESPIASHEPASPKGEGEFRCGLSRGSLSSQGREPLFRLDDPDGNAIELFEPARKS